MRDAAKRSLGAKGTAVPAPEDKKGACFDFQKTGKRKRGATCPYKHEKGRDKSKGRGKGKERSRSQSRSLSLALGKRRVSSGRQGAAIVAKIALSSAQRKPSLQRRRTRKRRRRRRRSHAREAALVDHQAPMLPLVLKASGSKVESPLLRLRRQLFASCVRWSWPQWSRKDPPSPSLARWEAWPRRSSPHHRLCAPILTIQKTLTVL